MPYWLVTCLSYNAQPCIWPGAQSACLVSCTSFCQAITLCILISFKETVKGILIKLHTKTCLRENNSAGSFFLTLTSNITYTSLLLILHLKQLFKIHSLLLIFHLSQFERIVHDTFDQILNNAWVFIMKLFHIFLTLIFLSDLDWITVLHLRYLQCILCWAQWYILLWHFIQRYRYLLIRAFSTSFSSDFDLLMALTLPVYLSYSKYFLQSIFYANI